MDALDEREKAMNRYKLLFQVLLLTVLLPCAFVALPGCTPASSGNWPSVLKCVTGAVPDAIADVSAVLLSDGTSSALSPTSDQKLEQLAVKYGADAVACAVKQLWGDWTNPGRAQTQETIAGSQRAAGFFQKHNIRVDKPSAPTGLNEHGARVPLAVVIARETRS